MVKKISILQYETVNQLYLSQTKRIVIKSIV